MTDQIQAASSPFAVPLGLCNPLWPAYGLMMGASLQWWALSRLARFASPVWAFEPKPKGETPVQTAPAEAPVAEVEIESTPYMASAVFAEAEGLVAPEAEAVAEPEAPIAPEPEQIGESGAATASATILGPGDVDELTLIRGIGPRVADALVERGVTTFRQLASWSEKDMHHFDTEMKLLGRSKRYDFLGQARALASQA